MDMRSEIEREREMLHRWANELPEDYRESVVRPVRVERHRDEMSRAEKILGLDAAGERCFYFHAFTLTDKRADADAALVVVDVYYERVIAWKLRSGLWVRLKTYADLLDHCKKRITMLPAELTMTP